MLHHLELALRSLRRTPGLSAITIAGIALGIGVSVTFVAAYFTVSANPIPRKSERLFYVQMDSWNPAEPFDDERPEEPPNQLTWTDMLGASASDIPTYASGMYKASLTVHPPREDTRPFRARTRMCRGDFFRMFDVPFLYGGPWDDAADAAAEQVVVLDRLTNERLFEGEDSVGRSLRVEDRVFRVVGVIDTWWPVPKFYDTHNNEFESPESMYVPIMLAPEMEVRSIGNDSGWKFYQGNEYSDMLASEQIWLQMWVQLDTVEQRDAYMAYLNGWAEQQRALGRFQRPTNNRLRSVMEWLRFERVVPDEVSATAIIALLFLLVCSVNLIGVLLGKFLARAPEIGVRRALGASRRWVFVQHLVECELIGLVGGAVGLGLAWLGLKLQARLYDVQFPLGFEGPTIAVAVGLSILAALIAGVYPAWRICRIAPAVHLKLQ